MEQRFTFDQIAGAYGASRPEYSQALVDDVVSYASLKPGDSILEVGCGDYETHLYMARRTGLDK